MNFVRPALLGLMLILTVKSVAGIKPFLHDLLEDQLSVRDLTIRFDGKEAYFSSQSLYGEVSAIMCIRKVDGKWTQPELISFSGNAKDLEPFLSPDGLRLYFASNRKAIDDSSERNYDIWYVERSELDAEWSDPINLGEPVNTSGNEFYPAVTTEGDLYFTYDGEGSKGEDDIFVSEYIDGKYSEPVSLGQAINSAGYEFNAFIAPDGSYLLFSGYNREDGFGSGDLYISYLGETGEWTPAINLGEAINSSRLDFCPFVDSNGILYFTSKRVALPEPPFGIESTEQWQKLLKSPQNGQSRIYQTDNSNWITDRAARNR